MLPILTSIDHLVRAANALNCCWEIQYGLVVIILELVVPFKTCQMHSKYVTSTSKKSSKMWGWIKDRISQKQHGLFILFRLISL